VQAEHRLSGSVLGVAMDGVGLGLDGTPWGGELLWLEGAQCTRLGHLRPLALPGGDRAALEPWRMAAAALHALGKTQDIPARFPEQPLAADIAALLRQGVRCPLTTSLGRHFDAVAGLLGIQPVARFEGQAAMRLEGVADAQGPARSLGAGVGWCLREGNELDLHPLLAWVAQEAAAPAGRAEGVQDTHSGEPLQTLLPVAAVFHATLAEALATWVMRAAEATGVRDVVFGGGCVLNQVLLRDLLPVLSAAGYRVHLPRQAPANDGGLSLGQAWVALQHLQAGTLEGMRPAIFQST
jgi:hydrogenase maturation protein HypF